MHVGPSDRINWSVEREGLIMRLAAMSYLCIAVRVKDSYTMYATNVLSYRFTVTLKMLKIDFNVGLLNPLNWYVCLCPPCLFL